MMSRRFVKKISVSIICVVLCFSVAGCGSFADSTVMKLLGIDGYISDEKSGDKKMEKNSKNKKSGEGSKSTKTSDKKNDGKGSDGSGKDKSGKDKSGKDDKSDKFKITAAEGRNIEFETFRCDDFSMKIPSGWRVDYGGINMWHSVRAYDPAEPRNQVFFLLKADFLFHTKEGKQFFQDYANTYGGSQALGAAPYLPNPTTEGFYEILPDYADYVLAVEPAFSGYTFPVFDGFTVQESFAGNSDYDSVALDNKLLRATFTANGQDGEGMFGGVVVNAMDNYSPGYDCGYYAVYNICAITAPEGELIQWQDVLSECLGSLEYSDSFISNTKAAGDAMVQNSRMISAYWEDVSNRVMSSWYARNIQNDIYLQKQSDKTLGYDRVYDTETGKIYRAAYGFMDNYDGGRFIPATDEQYAVPYDGFIE